MDVAVGMLDLRPFVKSAKSAQAILTAKCGGVQSSNGVLRDVRQESQGEHGR